MPDGTERPVAFASRTLTKAEIGLWTAREGSFKPDIWSAEISQILIWSGIYTVDRSPSIADNICQESWSTNLSCSAIATLVTYTICLSLWNQTLQRSEHSNSDAMSRLLFNEPSQPLEQSIFHVTTVADLPISSKEIREATQKEPILSRVLEYTLNGWPDKSSDENLLKMVVFYGVPE